ncbi:unnamed protein product [Linum trigynum]|uniref:Uncharacterized protein n=1 Tax=Linum trigynum TaxID=586398 RepID=A0AAV2GI38_9ROSI
MRHNRSSDCLLVIKPTERARRQRGRQPPAAFRHPIPNADLMEHVAAARENGHHVGLHELFQADRALITCTRNLASFLKARLRQCGQLYLFYLCCMLFLQEVSNERVKNHGDTTNRDGSQDSLDRGLSCRLGSAPFPEYRTVGHWCVVELKLAS